MYTLKDWDCTVQVMYFLILSQTMPAIPVENTCIYTSCNADYTYYKGRQATLLTFALADNFSIIVKYC